MNIVKTNPIGIDNRIQILQTYLYEKLTSDWGLTEQNSLFTGRCYPNKTEDGLIPEMYLGGTEYKEVLLDDTKRAQIFFIVADDREFVSTNLFEVDCSIIFIVNANAIYPNGRYDEEIRWDAIKYIDQDMLGFSLISMQTGIDTVFNEFSGWRRTQGIKYNDMHPFHCFRLNFSLTYRKEQCIT